MRKDVSSWLMLHHQDEQRMQVGTVRVMLTAQRQTRRCHLVCSRLAASAHPLIEATQNHGTAVSK